MRLVFLNQYGPPDPSPTARLLGEVAAYLRAHGHIVDIVSQGKGYHGRPASGRERLQREIAGLLAILRGGWRATQGKPDLVLALSSPPGLLFAAAVLARVRGVRLAHWAMDLYPELAVALGETKEGTLAAVLRAAMRWAYRQAALIVALDEDMRDHLQGAYGVPSEILAPWPAASFVQPATDAEPPAADTPWTWLYSGNLGRAHEWETLLQTQRLLETRGLPIRLVFQGDGAARAAAMQQAERLGLTRCEWKGYAPEAELAATLFAAGALVVTQRPETRGLLWPSKLAALETLPRPILYVGPADSAIARRLRSRGHAGVFAPGHAEDAAAWLEAQYRRNDSALPAFTGANPVARAEEGCARLEQWMLQCVNRAPGRPTPLA